MRIADRVRSCRIPLRDEQAVHVHTRPTPAQPFEVWVAAETAGVARLVDHVFTVDDLEARLAYATPGDLTWKDSPLDAVPKTRIEGGFIAGENVGYKPFRQDYARDYLASAITVLPTLRRPLGAARRAIPGTWSDGVMTLQLAPPSRASVSGAAPEGHPFAPLPAGGPDWWRFSAWLLTLLNGHSKRGVRSVVFHVGDELHLSAGFAATRQTLAHVFRRVS